MFALFGLGVPEMLVLVVSGLLVVWPLWRICSRAGFPGALSLVAIIPFGLVVLMFVLAFLEWPNRPRQSESQDTKDEPPDGEEGS